MATTDSERFFPYDAPYENQREAIERIENGLARGQDVLFEGACGTGKTLSALVPALSHARETDKTVVITTNVHQQMRQFVEEARAITREEAIRAVVFKGKASMCHIDVSYEECQVLRDTTRDLADSEIDKAQLERKQEELLEESQAGDQGAAEARSAVMDELESVDEEVSDLEEEPTCEHYYNNLVENTDAFYQWLFSDVRTPEEVYEYAEREGLCGYELLKDGMEGVDLVVCNYHHLLDPMIREQFFRWLDRDPEDVICVFDEAHNIEDAARDHATRTLTENTVDSALDECEDADDPRSEDAFAVFAAFRRALVSTYEDSFGFGDRGKVDENWEDVAIANESGRDELTLAFLEEYTGQGIDRDLKSALEFGEELDEQYEEAYRNGQAQTRAECQTLQAAAFIEGWLDDGAALGQYPVLGVRRDEGTEEVYGRAELYTCIPREVAESLFSSVHASVLMSATLRPFDVLEDVLGLEEPIEIAYGLEFPEENRRTFAVETPALFASERENPDTQRTIARVIEDAIRMTPGNSLIFFPSYYEAERYYGLVETSAGPYLDRPGVGAEELRQEFTESDDAVLFTSLWGTLTEGVSFDGDDAHTVLVVGVPYPHLDERMDAVQDAYQSIYGDANPDAGWEYAVEIPTIRKTRQALGRVLRSPEEVGVRALIDKRYTQTAEREMGKYSVRGAFPPEERAELIDISPEKLQFSMLNFYGDHDAYEEAPEPRLDG
ncbi:ATP-dependent DNA helicase [Halalkalicoccus jeotgali]|uniref:DEAD_2 domain protein n=1 Tax=Halalkalicoccus jeotgali (strain DSM 18796 / CECT 7217 / JCM 14584 / KCTC 4019 / B3) TaxID=795797 RepID=D8J515_HALJB|nr:ATP-dependent DNA helicase [Halalkalicoccus jeotgali]ADJ13596.1 DEAD_2 domain protein [Halalkalicoccus jeotgali B3]ELY33382.1 DEAD_2 domain-containing protein [Halalkalicoccus jeotgali B3]